MVTPEMLLFLAGKMGLPTSSERCGPCVFVRSDGDETWSIFNPATGNAQFGRLVVWAAMQGLILTVSPGIISADTIMNALLTGEGICARVPHDSTPDSIRAAAVVAVCRALGFDAAMEADK